MDKNNLRNGSALILVVDDDTAIRLLMRESLEQAGLSVVEAKNGIEALSVFEQSAPNLLLLDVKMPKMDGFSVCTRIRQRADGKEIPIILVTGLEDTGSIERAYQVGATDFITKPVVWTILSHRVRYLLRAGKAFQDLCLNEERLIQAQRVAGIGNWDWDVVNDRFYWSDEIYRIFGLQPDISDITFQTCIGVVHPADRQDVISAIDDALNNKKPYKIKHKIIRQDGTELTVEQQAEVIFTENGVPVRMHGTLQDVSAREKAASRIRQLAYYDHLTGLPNRQLFNETIGRAMCIAQREGTKLALIFLDLDRFKEVNDTLGHNVGDALLRNIAEYLVQSIRPSDVVTKIEKEDTSKTSLSRLGGDEFTILLPGLKEVEAAAHVCNRVLDYLSRPMKIEGQELFITGSMGIAIFPDDGEDIDTLLRHSDIAMYHAKKGGKNGFRFFTNHMNEKVKKRMSTEVQLKKALERNEFMLHYEPRIAIDTGSIVGVEALLRWNHPEMGVLLPGRFIAVAEVTGLINPIGEWVLNAACQTVYDWRHSGFAPMAIGVNLSSQQFKQRNLTELVQGILDANHLDPRHLELELTETAIVDDMKETIATFCKLNEMGLKLSLDNFGTGYSSLTHLKRLPIDSLKIDRSFINGITADTKDSTIIKAVIALTQGLNMTSVAEGVETSEQLEFLRIHGCRQAQGNLVSRPLSASQMEQLLYTDQSRMGVNPSVSANFTEGRTGIAGNS